MSPLNMLQLKGHYLPYMELDCLRQPKNQHSKHAVSVYSKKISQRMKLIRHIPNTMAKEVDGVRFFN